MPLTLKSVRTGDRAKQGRAVFHLRCGVLPSFTHLEQRPSLDKSSFRNVSPHATHFAVECPSRIGLLLLSSGHYRALSSTHDRIYIHLHCSVLGICLRGVKNHPVRDWSASDLSAFHDLLADGFALRAGGGDQGTHSINSVSHHQRGQICKRFVHAILSFLADGTDGQGAGGLCGADEGRQQLD